MNAIDAERPVQRVDVKSELDMVAAVLSARDRGLTIRAAGSGGSKNSCFRTGGIALSLAQYNRVRSLAGSTVTVEAGATVGQLNAELTRHGLGLCTPGEWAGATVAGALSSGTHGGSAQHGIFASSVRSLRLVMADGRIIDLDRDHPLFPHAAVSLGTFGVISTVTLECCERFHLRMLIRSVPFERYLEEFEATHHLHEFFSAVWFPTARRVLTFAADRVPAPARSIRRRERFTPATFVLNRLSCTFGIHAVRDTWLDASAVDSCERILSPIHDRSQRVHALRLLSKAWTEAEIAVPAERAPEALARLAPFLVAHRHTLTNPVGLRPSALDAFSLSPCFGRESYWIGLFYRQDARFEADLAAHVDDLGARCHWGKHIALSPAYLRRQYPRWDAFRAARMSVDPTGMFANHFTRRFEL